MHGLLRRLVGCEGTATSFEALENRLCMSAPTATIMSVSVSPTDIQVVVKYVAAGGVDLASISDGDIFISSPAKTMPVMPAFNLAAKLMWTPPVAADGSITARYTFAARTAAWDWADNGAYVVNFVNHQVKSRQNEWNVAANLKTYKLWFTTPHAEITSATLGNMSQWLIAVNYTDDVGLNTSTLGAGDLEVYGPNGVRGGIALTREAYRTGTATNMTVYYYAKVAQVAASWLDRGTYTMVMRANQVSDLAGNKIPTYTMGQYNYTSDRPAAQLVSSSVVGSQWVVKVRYSSDFGLDASSIGNGDIGYSGSKGAVLGRISGVPQVNADHSIVATYFFDAPDGGWVATPGAYTLSTKASQVFEMGTRPNQNSRLSVLSGYLINGAYMVTGPAEDAFGTTATVVSSARSSPTTWVFSVRFTDADGMNLSSLVSGQALMVYGPRSASTNNVYRSTLAVLSSSQQGPTSTLVTYRLASEAGNLVAGRYYLRTNMQQVKDAAGNIMPSVELLAFSI